jgi:ribosomal protein L7/L12
MSAAFRPSDKSTSKPAVVVRAGERLKAMKRYMDLTGVGMATARQVIESIT